MPSDPTGVYSVNIRESDFGNQTNWRYTGTPTSGIVQSFRATVMKSIAGVLSQESSPPSAARINWSGTSYSGTWSMDIVHACAGGEATAIDEDEVTTDVIMDVERFSDGELRKETSYNSDVFDCFTDLGGVPPQCFLAMYGSAHGERVFMPYPYAPPEGPEYIAPIATTRYPAISWIGGV